MFPFIIVIGILALLGMEDAETKTVPPVDTGAKGVPNSDPPTKESDNSDTDPPTT